MKRTEANVEAAIVAYYKAGHTMKEAGLKFGVCTVTVMNILNRLGI